MKIAENKYLGKLCKREHEFENTGKSLRFTNRGCVKCQKIRSEKYYEENRVFANLQAKNWKLRNRKRNNKIKLKAFYKYKNENLQEYLSYRRSHAKKIRGALSTTYIKNQLTIRTTLKFSDIPKELVEVKRLQLKLSRKLKEVIKNGRERQNINT